MKKFQVTVNGNTYEVLVEELQEGQVGSAPVPAVAAAPQTAPAPKKAAGPVTGTKVTAPMPGTILDIKVAEGASVKEGDVVAVLEAMKMENEIIASVSGKVLSVNTSKGASVDSGDLIATIG